MLDVSDLLGIIEWKIYVGSSSPFFSRRRLISSMEDGILAPAFSTDGSGLPYNTDSPDGKLRGVSTRI